MNNFIWIFPAVIAGQAYHKAMETKGFRKFIYFVLGIEFFIMSVIIQLEKELFVMLYF